MRKYPGFYSLCIINLYHQFNGLLNSNQVHACKPIACHICTNYN